MVWARLSSCVHSQCKPSGLMVVHLSSGGVWSLGIMTVGRSCHVTISCRYQRGHGVTCILDKGDQLGLMSERGCLQASMSCESGLPRSPADMMRPDTHEHR